MLWLLGLVILVMVAGFAATIMIGNSKSNHEENNGYFNRTGAKMAKLTGIYIVCIVVVLTIFIVLLTR